MIKTLWQNALAPLLESAPVLSAEQLALWREYQPLLSTEVAWRISQALFEAWTEQKQQATLAQLAQLIQALNAPAPELRSLRHPFWLDLYVFCLRLQPSTNSGFAPHRWQDAKLTLEDYRQKYKSPKKPQAWPVDFNLADLFVALQGGHFPAESEAALMGQGLEVLDREYAFWNLFFPAHAPDAFAIHAYFHLQAHVLALYTQVTLSQTHLLKPLMVPLFKALWNDQPNHIRILGELLERMAIILESATLAPQEGYFLCLAHCENLLRQLDDLSKVRQYRNDIFQKIYTAQAEHQQAVLDKINRFLKSSRPVLSVLNTLIRHPDQASYEILHPGVLPQRPEQKGWIFPIKHYVLNQQGEPQQIESLGNRQAQDLAIKEAHLIHAQRLAAFWKKPAQKIFQRVGSAELFESDWISEGEILLYALIDQLLGLKESGRESPESLASLIFELGLFREPAHPTLKLHALYDACERELCFSRTRQQPRGAGPDPAMQTLARCFLPGLHPRLYHLETLTAACQTLLQSTDLNQTLFRETLCPFPSFLSELPLRLMAPDILQNSFVHPLIYESNLSKADFQLVPAALMVGTVYTLPPLGCPSDRALPFIAGLHKYQLSPLAHLTRYLVDIQVLAQRQAARELAIEKAQESERSKQRSLKLEQERELERRNHRQQQDRIHEYDRVKESLEQIKGLFNQQQKLWDKLDNEWQPPEILWYGVQSTRTLNRAFNAHQASEQLPFGFHRPHQLDRPEQLTPFLHFLATGQATEIEHTPPDVEPWFQARTFLAEIYRLWAEQEQNLPVAQSIFAWLKTLLYDANNIESGVGQLRLTQIFYLLKYLGQALQAEHIPVFLWAREADQSLSDWKPLLEDPFFWQTLFTQAEWQKRLSGCDWSDDLTDTKQFKPSLTLAENQRPIVLITALERLVMEHLRSSDAHHLQIKRIQALVDLNAATPGFYLECICAQALTEAHIAEIENNLQAEDPLPHDFSTILQKLSQSLGQRFSRQQVVNEAHFEQWSSTEAQRGFYLHAFADPENPEAMQTRIVLGIGQVKDLKIQLHQAFANAVYEREEEL